MIIYGEGTNKNKWRQLREVSRVGVVFTLEFKKLKILHIGCKNPHTEKVSDLLGWAYSRVCGLNNTSDTESRLKMGR